MDQIKFIESNSSLNIMVPQKLYSREAVINCLYWRLNDFNIDSFIVKEDFFQINLDLDNFTNQQIESIKTTFRNDLIDFELREIVLNETKNVRELIIAKAFANGSLDEQ